MTALLLSYALIASSLVLSAIAFAAGFLIAKPIYYRRGIAQGGAIEWQRRYFADVEKERNRREANGQFKAKGSS